MSESKMMPPLDGRANPCLCCPPILATLPMDRIIAVGFGDAHVSRDGELVYREPGPRAAMKPCAICGGEGRIGELYASLAVERTKEWDALPICGTCGGEGDVDDPDAPEPVYWDVDEAEKAAAADPDHDWQIVLFGPLHGEVYQRQAPGQWLLIEKNEGFA